MSTHDPSGQHALVPGFELGGVIGKGGFATVYRARQVSLDRDVAIKIDSRVLDDERNQRRFLRESTAAALISAHPHVVSLIDAGTTRDNRPFLIMEVCENGSVGQLVKRSGPLPAPDVVELGIAISSALAAAHEVGILHRDIKPSNIMIDAYGTPRLGDFGLAALPAQGEMSVTLEALTPAYAAPEAFEQAAPSKRADVWALGATLYSVLTGVAPRHHPDGSAQTVAEIIKSLYTRLPAAPHIQGADPLFSIIWRATAPQAEQRFADAGELHAALLDLRGVLGRPRNVLGGGEVTRMVPGQLQQQRFPAGPPTPGAQGSGSLRSLPSPGSGPGAMPPAALSAGLEAKTRPRRAWPYVVGALALVAVGGGGYLGAQLLNQGTPVAEQLPGGATTPPVTAPGQGTPTPTVPSPSPEPSGELSPEPSSAPSPLPSLGDDFVGLVPEVPICFGGLTSISGYYNAAQVDCDGGQAWEAYAYGTLVDETPSANIADVEKDPRVVASCTPEALAHYTALPIDELEVQVLPPTEAEFATGSRLYFCLASVPDGLTGSFRR